MKYTAKILSYLVAWASVLSAVRASTPVQLELAVKLPYTKGITFECSQTFNGKASHSDGVNNYGIDFDMPLGTPVIASAYGRVVYVRDGYDKGGNDPAYKDLSNLIWVDHGNGNFTLYEHLQFQSIIVKQGQLVNAGQLLARSGNTGFATAPHLHFAVTNVSRISVPFRFQDVQGSGIPQAGIRYTSANDGNGTQWFTGDSALPRGLFNSDHVSLTTDTPAVFLRYSQEYKFGGRVDNGATRVALFITQFGGGRAIASKRFSVAPDGTFEGSVTLSDFKEAIDLGKSMQYGLVALDENGNGQCGNMPILVPYEEDNKASDPIVTRLQLPIPEGVTAQYSRLGNKPGEESIALSVPADVPITAPAGARIVCMSDDHCPECQNRNVASTKSILLDHGDGCLTRICCVKLSKLAIGEILGEGDQIGSGFRAGSNELSQVSMCVTVATGAYVHIGGLGSLVDAVDRPPSGIIEHLPGDAAPHIFRRDSQLSGGEFSKGGISTVRGTPAMTFGRTAEYWLEGTASPGIGRVEMKIRNRGTKKTVRTTGVDVTSGAFKLQLLLRDLPDLQQGEMWEWTLVGFGSAAKFGDVRWLPFLLMK